MIEAPEPPHQPHGTGIRWFDLGITLTLVLVSLGSLYVALHTGATMEKLVEQNARLVRANSTPLLIVGHGNQGEDGTPKLGFSIQNSGTGPARIVWVEIRHNDKPAKNGLDLIGAVAGGTPGVTFTSSQIAPSMLVAGEERNFLVWPRPPATDAEGLKAWKALDSARWKLSFQACYCSVFDECWTSSLSADVPKPVKACDAKGRTSYFG
jgi:hypothetical protein